MGNHSSNLKNDYEKALSRFNRGKVALLRSIFKNLTEHSTSPGKTVDKTTFLKYFPLPGMMGERLFSVFDRDTSGGIDFQEFLTGMGLIYRGTVDEKKRFLFEMYDLDGDGVVTREELFTMLSHIPSAFKILDAAMMDGNRPPQIGVREDMEMKSRIRTIVDTAFKNKGKGDNLTFEEFTRVVNKTPEILEIINVFYDEALPEHDFACRTSKITEGPLPRVSIWTTAQMRTPPMRPREAPLVETMPRGTLPKKCAELECESRSVTSQSSRAAGVLRRKLSGSINSVTSGLQAACHSVTSVAASRENDIESPRSEELEPASSTQSTPHMGPMCPMCMLRVTMPYCMRCGAVLSHCGTKALFCEGCSWAIETISFCFRCGQPLKRMLGPPTATTASVATASVETKSWAQSIPLALNSQFSLDTNYATRRSGDSIHGSEHPSLSGKSTPRISPSNGLVAAIPPMNALRVNSKDDDQGDRLKTQGPSSSSTAVPQMCGEMAKIGRRVKTLRMRYFVLRDRFLYYYQSEQDIRTENGPRGVIFLEGAFVRAVDDQSDTCALEIRNATTRRIYHCKTLKERDRWVEVLAKASRNNYFVHDFYDITPTELGNGKFAVVYLAARKQDKLEVAIKVISKADVGEDSREFIRTEIAILKLVHHPNLVTMVDMFDESEKLYLVMEKVDGGDLLRRLMSLPSKRVLEKTARVISLHLVRAVRFLHEHGITHRDLKPENVLIVDPIHEDPVKNAKITSVKVTDFGLSCITQAAMDAQLGTVAYAAPEILKNLQYDRQVDMWSLGAIAFIVLAGELPFRGRTLKDIAVSTVKGNYSFSAPIWNEISPDAKNFVSSLLRLRPSERLSSLQVINHPWFSDGSDFRRST